MDKILLDTLKGKKVAILGLGQTGVSVVNACLRSCVKCIAWDDDDDKNKLIENNKNVQLINLRLEKNWKNQNIKALIVSPGIKDSHPAIKIAKEKNIRVYCDIDLLFNNCKNAKYIGITGTNGKSTTAALVYHLLKLAGVKTAFGGNIGFPVLDLPKLNCEGWYVLEVSSYQLYLCEDIKFDIAVLLNLSPDHLEYHGSLKKYQDAKMKIVQHQTSKDKFIAGVDDSATVGCAMQVSKKNRLVIPISANNLIPGGLGWLDGILFDARDNSVKKITSDKKISLKGEHNKQNISAAVAIAKCLDIPEDKIIEGLESFTALEDRLAKITTINNVVFYNDSKATNVASATKALQSFPSCIWICGGQAKKNDDWPGITLYIKNIKKAFVIGENAKMIGDIISPFIPVEYCDTVSQAVNLAYKKAVTLSGEQIVCMSPGCASFDMYDNYAERGKDFVKSVNNLEQTINLSN